MIIKLVEIYEKKGINALSSTLSENAHVKEYSLREVFVNPEHVVMLRTNIRLAEKSKSVHMPEELHTAQEYTTIYINRGHGGIEINVVGNPQLVEEKLNVGQKVLKG